MTWDLPISVEIDDVIYKIRNNCDYRVVLDCIDALNDTDLNVRQRIECALIIFYEDLTGLTDFEAAICEMFRVINIGEDEVVKPNKPRLLNWSHDFNYISPPISRVLGYDVRTPDKYTHWWTFIGGYNEIGECTFANIVAIRSKKLKGQKLEKHEIEFCREHRKMIDLPQNLTAEEKALLEAEW